MLAGVLFLPQSISISAGGVNIFGMRFLEVIAAARIVTRGELSFLKLNRIDKILALFFVYSTLVFILRSDEGIAYQIGLAVDGLLCYFAFRIFLKDITDMLWLLRAFVWILLPFTCLVLIESKTQQNPFSIFGSVTYGGDWLREGRLRCQGSFRHCSLLGTLGASFISLYLAAIVGRFDRKSAWLGIILCLMIVWASNSGGPISCVANVVFCWMIWPIRQHVRWVRRAVFVLFVVATITMEAPIFYLPAKVSSITGGDGWHRSYLMEVAYRDLGKWWLWGMHLRETIDWFPYHNYGTGFADITNQFVAYGLDSGLPSMILFMLVLAFALQESAKATKVAGTHQDPNIKYLAWGLCSVLIMHIANWFGIVYFDQSYVIWYLHLAMIGSLCSQVNSADNIKLEPFNVGTIAISSS